MAEVLQLLGDGGVEALQLLGDREHLGLEVLGDGSVLNLRCPNTLKLLGTGGEKRLRGRSSFADGTALCLKLGSGLIGQA
eukprot:1823171-Alexandrium_andersonii.AAC.1